MEVAQEGTEEVAQPVRQPLPTPALLSTAEMLSPRSLMQLPTWSRGSNKDVQSASPALDLSSGSLHGRKLCTTWKERCQQIAREDSALARLGMDTGEQLSEQECENLCGRVRSLLLKEPNIVQVHAPVTIVGDIHGQYLDLLNILTMCGPVPETSYLFLGNYVTRGYDGLSVVFLVFLLKARYPKKVTLLRGNHETAHLTQYYAFFDECMRQYGNSGPTVWRSICNCFNALPLCAVLEDRVFCVHSGLSPSADTLDQISAVSRDVEIPSEGIINDLLWSDPGENEGWGLVGRATQFSFGADVTRDFLQKHNLDLLIRSHQLAIDGTTQLHEEKMLHIWSAPNYRNRCGNTGAVVQFDEHMKHTVLTFDAVPWPSSSHQGTPSRRSPDYIPGLATPSGRSIEG